MSRGPDDYDDDAGRPRRRRDYDEEEDLGRPRRTERAGLDGMFLDTNMVVLVLFGVCCGGIALILSIIELAMGKDPEAKRKATIVLIIAAILQVVGFIIYLAAGAMQLKQGGRGF